MNAGIDVVDLEGELAEMAGVTVILGLPVVGEFQQRRFVTSILFADRFDRPATFWTHCSRHQALVAYELSLLNSLAPDM